MNSCISQNDFPESQYVRFFVSELVVGDFYFQVFFSPKLIFEFYWSIVDLQCFSIVTFSYCCSSVAQSCPTLCDPRDSSTPGLPVHHQLLEFAQVHAHCIGDAIQPSHPLTPSYPYSFLASGSFPISPLLYIYTYIIFHIIFHYSKLLTIVTCAIQETSVACCVSTFLKIRTLAFCSYCQAHGTKMSSIF